MKAILLFLLAFSALQITSAQTVFAPQGATWQFRASPYEYHHGRAAGATVVSGKSCSNIQFYSHHTGYPSQPEGGIITYASGDTVFKVIGSRFVPLYIFNVHAGDTVSYYKPHFFDNDSFFHVRIDSVKQMLWGGQMLKTVFARTIDFAGSQWAAFSSDILDVSHQLYVERIGGVYCDGLIPWMRSRLPECICGISCYYDGTIDVRLSRDSCNGIPEGIEQVIPLDFSIYPNPAPNTATLLFTKQLMTNVTLNIYDINGRKCYEASMAKGVTQFVIPLNHLSSGAYAVSIYSQAGITVRTLVKE